MIQISNSLSYNPNVFFGPAGAAHVVFEQGGDRWHLAYTNDRGTPGKFVAPVVIGENIDVREQPQIVMTTQGLFVIFQGYANGYGSGSADIFCVSSPDGGKTWGKPLPLSHPADRLHRYVPRVAPMPDGTVALVYGLGNQKIVLRLFSSGQWTPELVVAPLTQAPRFPAVAHSAPYLHVLCSSGNGNDDLRYTRSQDLGKTWEPAKNLSNHPLTSKRSAIFSDGAGLLYVAYADSNTGPVKFTQSNDNGGTWSAPIPISQKAANFPAVFQHDGVANVIDQEGFDAKCTVSRYAGFGPCWVGQELNTDATIMEHVPAVATGARGPFVVFHGKVNATAPYTISGMFV